MRHAPCISGFSVRGSGRRSYLSLIVCCLIIVSFQMSTVRNTVFSQATAKRVEAVDPKQLGRFVIRGELASANEESERLIIYYRNLVAADPQRKDPWAALHVFQVGYYMCAKAQVLAL